MKIFLLIALSLLSPRFAFAQLDMNQIVAPYLVNDIAYVENKAGVRRSLFSDSYAPEIKACQSVNQSPSMLNYHSNPTNYLKSLEHFKAVTDKTCVKVAIKPTHCAQRLVLQDCYQRLYQLFEQENSQSASVMSASHSRKGTPSAGAARFEEASIGGTDASGR